MNRHRRRVHIEARHVGRSLHRDRAGHSCNVPFRIEGSVGRNVPISSHDATDEAVVFTAKTVVGGVDAVAIFTVAGSPTLYPVARICTVSVL